MNARAAASPSRKQHPHGFYVEPRWAVDLLADLLAPKMRHLLGLDDVVWDPCCGLGTIPSVFAERRIRVRATALVDRGADRSYWLGEVDFLNCGHVVESNRGVSIVMNPPYGKAAEAFVRRALDLATRFVATLVPVSWLCSTGRNALFCERPPLTVAFLSSRPSMPPGDKIEALGNKAFRGGSVDYCWIIWDVRQRQPMTRAVWLSRGAR